MNTDEIERFLRCHVTNFDGVFSIDTLPENPHLLVCNTEPSDEAGRHWICIYIKDDCGEFFDSFGRAPNSVFEQYMNCHCAVWTFNHKQLQSVISKFCGHYCIYFCILRSHGIDMSKIVRSFTNDTGLNDALVHIFVCRRQRIKRF